MPRYLVTGEMTISVRVFVDADNPKEALEKASEAPVYELCNHCGRGEADEWSPGGLDGEVDNMRINHDESEDDVEL